MLRMDIPKLPFFLEVDLSSPVMVWLELEYWCLCPVHHLGRKEREGGLALSGYFNSGVFHQNVLIRVWGLFAWRDCPFFLFRVWLWTTPMILCWNDGKFLQSVAMPLRAALQVRYSPHFPWPANIPSFAGEWWDKPSALSQCVGGIHDKSMSWTD